MRRNAAKHYSESSGSNEAEVVVIANEDGYGSGVFGPWYEWWNKAQQGKFYNDDGNDRNGEGARAVHLSLIHI